ncbi:MAG TPA: sulfatase, partial [Nannocystaceae bacterium]|nr:sulfatase [Nannocystaceae bacterium]
MKALAIVGLAAIVACDRDPAPVASDPTSEVVVPRVGERDNAPTPRIETTDLWLDLVAQRPSAVVSRDGAVVVELGHESARKHLALARMDTWSLGRDIDGRLAGVVVGKTAALDLPLDGELAPALHPDVDGKPGLAVALTLRALAPNQTMTVLWNERVLANLAVGQAWERRTLSLPADVVRAGENRLRLHFRRVGVEGTQERAAAVERVELGTHARIVAPPVDDGSPAMRVVPTPGGDVRLELTPGSGLAYYFEPPRRGRLELDLAGEGAFDVLVSTAADHEKGRAPTVLSQEPLRPTGDRRALDLSAWGEVPIRLELRIRRARDREGTARIGSARVLARRAVPFDRRERGPRDVVVLAIEGARADAFELGVRPALPEIEALFAESLVFERAYAVSPAAVPSHAAWLSSVAPPTHLTVRGTFVADGQTLLPELFQRTGHVRELVTANADVGEERGLVQGFDGVHVQGGEGKDDHARAVVAAARARMSGRTGPWFLMLNVNDPQAPYEPPRELLGDAAMPPRGPMAHMTHVWVGRVRLGKWWPDDRELAWVRRLYRGEIQMVSSAVGDLVAFLRETHRLDRAVIVVVGVHGEEFVEHGGAGHDSKLYEESLRVPLAIHAPELLAPGRVDVPVDLLDLAPTIADLLGMPAPQTWQGQSLVPVIDDPEPPPRLVVAYLGDGSRAAIVGHAKLWLGPGLSERFFDLRADPRERKDAIATGGVALRIVRTALAWEIAHADRWRRGRWGTGAALRPAFAID